MFWYNLGFIDILNGCNLSLGPFKNPTPAKIQSWAKREKAVVGGGEGGKWCV